MFHQLVGFVVSSNVIPEGVATVCLREDPVCVATEGGPANNGRVGRQCPGASFTASQSSVHR